MAEENIDLLLSPEKDVAGSTEIGENSAANPDSLNNQCCAHVPNRRASIAAFRDNSPRKWDNARRYSSVIKPDSANMSQLIVVPHYLRASTGSCHDICKYGRRHVSEDKPWKPLETRDLGKQKKEKIAKNEPSLDTKKGTPALKPFIVSKYYTPKLEMFYFPGQNDPLSSSKTHLSPNSSTKRPALSRPREVVKSEILLPSEKVKGSLIDNTMSRMDKKTCDQPAKRLSSVTSKPVKAKTSSASKNSDVMHGKGGKKCDVNNGRKMTSPTFSAKRPLVPRVALLPPKFVVTKIVDIKPKKSGPAKSLPPVKGRNRVHAVETGRSNGEVPEKILHVIKSGTEMPRSSLSREVHDDHIRSSANEADDFVSEKTMCVEICEVQPVKGDQQSLSHAKCLSVLPHEENDKDIKNSGEQADECVSEKTVPVEIGKVQQPVSDDDAKSALLSSHEEVDKKAKCNGNEAADNEFAPDRTTSVEIGEVQALNAKSPSLSSHEVDGEEIKNIDKVQTVKENRKKTPRKSKTAISEDKYSTPMKLKFRRGRVIDLQTNNNNNIPTRLRFRRARMISGDKEHEPLKVHFNKTSKKSHVVVSEDKYISPVKSLRSTDGVVDPHSDNNVPRRLRFRMPRVHVAESDDLRRRSFKNAGGKDDLASAEFSSRRVILKHRSFQGKKNNRVLYNNVIEETASKLAESRRSKVKALVGAFETVISLEERKPIARS